MSNETVSQVTIEGIARTFGLSVEQVSEYKAQLDRLNEADGEIEVYTPKTSPKYHENSARCQGNEEPCFICGKPVKNKSGYWARISDGGVSMATDEYADRPENIAGDLGNYPIGPECYRKLPASVKHLARKTDWR